MAGPLRRPGQPRGTLPGVNRELLRAFCEEWGIPISPEQEEVVAAYLESLYRHNQTRNLTRVPLEDATERHICDSLLPLDLFSEESDVLDIGTLPGLPAWPLALFRPDLLVTAIDATAKGFCVMEDCPLSNLEWRQARIEETNVRLKYDVVTGRAVAPLSAQLEISAQPCRVGGRIIAYRTVADMTEAKQFPAEELGLELEDLVVRVLPSGVERLFAVYRKRGRTSSAYPRSWARIKNDPLGARRQSGA